MADERVRRRSGGGYQKREAWVMKREWKEKREEKGKSERRKEKK